MAPATSFNIIIFCLSAIMINSCIGQLCEWTVGVNKLDLSCLSGKVLTTNEIINGETKNEYSFSVCSNTQLCGDDDVMVAQHPKDLPGRCFNIGSFDPSIQPIYNDISGGQWKFTYVGDPQDCPPPGREWIPTFICDETTASQIGLVSEADKCAYSVAIRTKYACLGQNYECSEDESAASDGLSTGWIFIIVLMSAFCSYCIIGYIYMAKRVNTDKGFSDCSNNIPNKSMWVKFCFLVMAGCSVTKDYLVGLMNKDNDYDGSGDRDGDDSNSREESSISDGYQLELE